MLAPPKLYIIYEDYVVAGAHKTIHNITGMWSADAPPKLYIIYENYVVVGAHKTIRNITGI